MTDVGVLEQVVREWAADHAQVREEAAVRAALLARSSYEQGEPIGVACERAREFVRGWVAHPSH